MKDIKEIKTALLGKPLKDSELGDEKYSVLWGIPVFASDAISSVSYAGEEILLVLIPALGMAAFRNFLPVVAAIIGLLALLVLCYRQTIQAYPQGGGAYIVAAENLGEKSGLVAGSALILGYTLTVAVSACAGAAAITSAFPAMAPFKAVMAFLLVVLLTWGNLRGMRESAVMFGVPTYLFILSMIALIVTGLIRYLSGSFTPAEQVIAIENAQDTMIFVILRAFASGCTALTGVEAVSNGVPSFKDPAQKNAMKVLFAMAGFVCLVFLGVSTLITLYKIVPNDQETALSQLASAVFGNGTIMYFVIQIMTVVILTLAANTAFAGMPLLMAVMARDGYLPRRMVDRGSRLNFSNGILLLSGAASILIFAFNGDQHLLLPLYASGVFISFLLSQLGMLLHWVHNKGEGWKLKAVINALGTLVTGTVLIIIVIMKFSTGAWITILCTALLTGMMLLIKKHYDKVAADLRIAGIEEAKEVLKESESDENAKAKVILPVQSINRSFLKTLNYAADSGFDDFELYNVSATEEEALKLKAQIEELGYGDRFVYDVTEYRNTNEVLLDHIKQEAEKPEVSKLTVMMAAIVVTNPLKKILHNQTTARLSKKLSQYKHVAVFTVPYIV